MILEIISAAFGLIGTLLLALRGPRAGWGFVAYLVSNLGWLVFASRHAHWGLLAQYLGFLVTSVIGIYTWLIRPRPADYWSAKDTAQAVDAILAELRRDLVCLTDTKVGEYTSAPVSSDVLRAIFRRGVMWGRQQAAGVAP